MGPVVQVELEIHQPSRQPVVILHQQILNKDETGALGEITLQTMIINYKVVAAVVVVAFRHLQTVLVEQAHLL